MDKSAQLEGEIEKHVSKFENVPTLQEFQLDEYKLNLKIRHCVIALIFLNFFAIDYLCDGILWS